jgi:hypothetical protein
MGPVVGQETSAGPWPGFSTTVPPAIASAGAIGTSAFAAHGDHTHAFDFPGYAPSLAGMQHGGVIQQTYAAPNATPSVLTMTAGNVPFGGASGVLTQSAGINYTAATNRLTLLQDGTGGDAQLFLDGPLTGGGFSAVQIDYGSAGTPVYRERILSIPGTITDKYQTMLDAGATNNVRWDNAGGFITGIAYVNAQDAGWGAPAVMSAGSTKGFLYLPTITGVPGVPVNLANFTNMAPCVVDTSGNFLRIYVTGGAPGWKSIALV